MIKTQPGIPVATKIAIQKRLNEASQVENDNTEWMRLLEKIVMDYPYCLEALWKLFLYNSVNGHHKIAYEYNKKLLEAVRKDFNYMEVCQDRESRFIDTRIERDILRYEYKMMNRRWCTIYGFMMLLILIFIICR